MDLWGIFNRMNFTEHTFEPSFRLADLFFSTVLNPDEGAIIPRNYIYLRQNNVETEDNVVYPFKLDHEITFYDLGK